MDVYINGEQRNFTQVEVGLLRASALTKGAKYLDLIASEDNRKIAEVFWRDAPDYFFVIPASSSGKYHWATGIGGLFDHVLMGMYCAKELARTFGLSQEETDLAVVAMAGHDCLKYGIDYDKRYFDMHPFLPRSHYRTALEDVDQAKLDVVFTSIERHMGSLNNGEWTCASVKPETSLQQVVHLADYMASRRDIRLVPKEDE